MEKNLRTPLFVKQTNCGAKMVPFAGWDMPVSFGSIIEEHKAVRERAGLFDISHMGELRFSGSGVAEKIERTFSRRVSDLAVGAGRYGLLLTEAGTVVDDIIIYRVGDDEFFAVINASRIDADIKHLGDVCGKDSFYDESRNWAALALQGPLAVGIWEKFSTSQAPQRFGISKFSAKGLSGYVARTGYTGEDGVEIIIPPDQAISVWDELNALGAMPCGLGARDSLRVEAGYPLYGHELSEELTALESGAGWAVDFTKDSDWLGTTVLRKQKADGLPRKLVFISSQEPGAIPREGYSLYHEQDKIGIVTSGVFGPTVGRGVGMAIVQSPYFQQTAQFDMEIRGRRAKVQLEKKAAYRRKDL